MILKYDKNSYWDECSRLRTEDFAQRMRGVSEKYLREGTNYVTLITRRSLYQALQGDLGKYLQKNARSSLSGRAIRETEEYFKSDKILLSIMNRIEDVFKHYHGADRVRFEGGIQLSEEEKQQITTILEARGPIPGPQ